MHLRLLQFFVVLCCVAACSRQAYAQDLLPDAGAPDADSVAATPPVALDATADSTVQRRLRAVFGSIDEFADVTVTVDNGVVRLRGDVLQAETSTKAEELAGRFDGVIFVDNDITAETSVETRVAPAVARVQEYVNRAAALLPVLGVALVVLFFFWGLSLLVSRWEAPVSRLRMNPLVWGLIRRILRIVVFLVGLLLASDILGVTALVSTLLGTAGIVGLAVGFAFQDIIENYLAGAILSIRHPFQVNDLVRIEDHEGQVVRLTARELVLLTMEGNHVQLPNAKVFKSTLVNYSRNPRRRFDFEVGFGTNEDLVRALRIGVRTLEAMKGVLDDPPPFARIESLGDSTVVVRFFGWVNQREADFMKVRSEALRLVKSALDEAGVEMPEPAYRVLHRPLDQPAAGQERSAEAPATMREAEEVDVAPDGKLEQQVAEDLARQGEENLLR